MFRRVVSILFVVFALPVPCRCADENPEPQGGIVSDEEAALQARLTAASDELHEKREQLARLLKEIDELEKFTGEYGELLVRCRFVEADPSILNRLGLTHDDDASAEDIPRNAVRSAIANEVIEAMRADGSLRIISEPTLRTQSGVPAGYFSGGEIALIHSETDNARIEWKEFGERADVTPVILPGGRVRLDVALEHSVRDFANAVRVHDSVIPGLTTRRVRTQIELADGETLIVLLRAGEATRAERDCNESADSVPMVVLFTVEVEPVENQQ